MWVTTILVWKVPIFLSLDTTRNNGMGAFDLEVPTAGRVGRNPEGKRPLSTPPTGRMGVVLPAPRLLLSLRGDDTVWTAPHPFPASVSMVWTRCVLPYTPLSRGISIVFSYPYTGCITQRWAIWQRVVTRTCWIVTIVTITQTCG